MQAGGPLKRFEIFTLALPGMWNFYCRFADNCVLVYHNFREVVILYLKQRSRNSKQCAGQTDNFEI
jgi:hypothetical protein